MRFKPHKNKQYGYIPHIWIYLCKKGNNMESTVKKPDRRVLKTKKAIRNAFAELLSQKSIDEITVTDITYTADINRKTFYNHYSGVYQLIDEIENGIIASFDSAVADIDLKEALQQPRAIFENLHNIINRDFDFYGYLLKINGNWSLISKVTALLKSRIKKALLLQTRIEENKADVIIDFSISGMIAAYQSWFNSDRTQTIEEISEIIGMMCFSGLSGIVTMM